MNYNYKEKINRNKSIFNKHNETIADVEFSIKGLSKIFQIFLAVIRYPL